MAGQGQVKCHVEGTVAEGAKAVGLVIYRDRTDPKENPLQLTVKDGRFECDVEDTQVERWHIVDFGEVLGKGMTSRITSHPLKKSQFFAFSGIFNGFAPPILTFEIQEKIFASKYAILAKIPHFSNCLTMKPLQR